MRSSGHAECDRVADEGRRRAGGERGQEAVSCICLYATSVPSLLAVSSVRLATSLLFSWDFARLR